MLTALLATPAGLHNCQTCWVHSVRLHDPGQCQPSQSQWGEEKWLLEHFFAAKRNGVYVELGAVDGVRFSNTLALHTCRDWTGVLVEANRANYHLLRVNAPKYRGAAARRARKLREPGQRKLPRNYVMYVHTYIHTYIPVTS